MRRGTEWRRAAALCSVAGIQMAHHEEPQIAGHLIAAVSPPIKDGMMEASGAPGFGVLLDDAMIRRYRAD